MKKLLAGMMLILLLAACGSTQKLTIFSEDADRLVLQSGTDGTSVTLTDETTIANITEEITSLTYEAKKSEAYTGWSYRLQWFAGDQMIDEITLLNEKVVDDGMQCYEVTDGSLDLEYLAVILTQAQKEALPEVKVDYATDEVLSRYESYEEYTMEGEENNVRTLFTAEKTVTNVRLYSIALEEVTEEGNLTFRAEQELYALNQLTGEKPFVAEVPFYGTIPNIGIVYTTEKGVEKQFALTMSGKDGSIFLMKSSILTE